MDELALEMQSNMDKTIANLEEQFKTLRTGRASSSVLDRIECDYYGDRIPVNQISSISIPEPRQILIKPYDRNDVRAIVEAISKSDLGINPINDGNQIRLVFPPLTEERRKDLVKTAKKYAEDSKVAIRNIRRDYLELLKASDEYSDDLKKRIEADIQKVTEDTNKKVESVFKEKEVEIMTI
ncbi:MAG TPA: ribosome recycling factor [Bacilli bacterium]|nr:ribosome recycling factor [Bacilli bacterium]